MHPQEQKRLYLLEAQHKNRGMPLPLLLVLMGVHVVSRDADGNDRFGRLDTGVSVCRLTQAERSMGCQRLHDRPPGARRPPHISLP